MLRFGANGDDVLERLRGSAASSSPTLQAAVRGLGGSSSSRSWPRRCTWATSAQPQRRGLRAAVQAADAGAAEGGRPGDAVARALEFVAGNDHFFLNVSMAACKAMIDAAHGVAGSSMVTAMARNGVNFGIRLSAASATAGSRRRANPVDGLYFPGYSVEDAAADIGDSAITETDGLGGFAMAASPAIVQFVGGTPADATANSRRMLSITLGTNPAFTLPALTSAAPRPASTPAAVVDSRHAADHQHRHRPPRGRRRADRRGDHARRRWSASSPRLSSLAQRERVSGEQGGGRRLRRQRAGDRRRTRFDPRSSTTPSAAPCPHCWTWSSGLGPGGVAWQRAAGRVHPAAFGDRQDEVDPVPVDYAVADTQGAIGYMFVKALRNELAPGASTAGLALVTQTVVDRRSRLRPSGEARRLAYG